MEIGTPIAITNADSWPCGDSMAKYIGKADIISRSCRFYSPTHGLSVKCFILENTPCWWPESSLVSLYTEVI